MLWSFAYVVKVLKKNRRGEIHADFRVMVTSVKEGNGN